MNPIRAALAFVPLLVLTASTSFSMEPGAQDGHFKPGLPTQRARVLEDYGKLPLGFEANQGQTDTQVKFLSRGEGYSFFLKPSEAVMSLGGKSCPPSAKSDPRWLPVKTVETCANASGTVVRMTMMGSDVNAQIEGQDELPGKSNYFQGHVSSAWHTNVSNYRKVRYTNIYPGIDLVYYGNQRQLEHDFIVAPGADPKVIRLSFTGANSPSIERNGDLRIQTQNGLAKLKKPVLYQQIDGVRRPVTGRYVRSGRNEFAFSIGRYDRKQKLIIDPVLAYSTYFGGNGNTRIRGVAADADGNAYITGSTQAPDFPLSNPLYYKPGTNYAIGFVSKISADGQTLLYSTYLGDSSAEVDCAGIATDGQGNAYVTGYTSSSVFPVVHALQPTKAGQIDAFVTKLNPTGSALEYSTYLGGGKEDYANAIAVDKDGATYIAGTSTSSKFPTVNAFSTSGNSFLSKLNPAGSALLYSTRFGGFISSVAVDPLGEAIVAGDTTVLDIPLRNPLFTTLLPYPGGCSTCEEAAFVTKFNSTGADLIFSTFLGSGGVSGVATNQTGDAFVTGPASLPDRFTNPQSLFQATDEQTSGAFVSRIKADGSSYVYSTYLVSSQPGTFGSYGSGIAADADGNAYVTGYTHDGLPVVAAIQNRPGMAPGSSNASDAFVAKIDPAGSRLIYSTYLGGSADEGSVGVALAEKGNAVVAGGTGSRDFPLYNPLIAKPSGLFIAKIFETPKHFSVTDVVDNSTASPGDNLFYNIVVTNTGFDTASGVLNITSLREIFHKCRGEVTCTFNSPHNRASVQLGPVAPGGKVIVQLFASVLKSAGDYNLVTNTATVTSGAPYNEEDTATATTTVREKADIRLYSSLIDSTNGLLHYQHKVTNSAGDNAHAVLLLDPLPAHTTFVSASTTMGKCSFHPTLGTYGAVRCPVGNLVTFTSAQVDVVLQASSAACPAVTNSTSVTSQSIQAYSYPPQNESTIVTTLPDSVCKK